MIFTKKQLEKVKKDKCFLALLHVLVDTKGNPTTTDIKKCGYGFEAFLRLSQRNSHNLYRNALAMLAEIEN